MAKYTIELGTLVKAGFSVFDESWGTFDPTHKPVLCDKIVRHYWFNEIGAETAERFRFYINTQLCEIMPYYNMLYESALWDLLPLYNQWIENTSEGTQEQRQKGETSGRVDKAALQLMVNNIKSMSDATSAGDVTGGLTGSKKWDETDIIDVTENEKTGTTGKEQSTFTETDTRSMKGNTQTTADETKTGESTKGTKTVSGQDTRGTETRNTTTMSSDTPQGEIVNNQFQIDSNYLTHYDHSTESRQTTGRADETVTGDETMTDKTVSNLVRKDDSSEKEETGKQGTTTKTIDTTVNRDLKRKDIVDKAGKESTSEQKEEHTTGQEIKSGEQFTEGTTDNRSTDTSASVTDTATDTTQKTVSVTKGNINISRSELVRKYRELYINIDLEIIRALANNFMGVF